MWVMLAMWYFEGTPTSQVGSVIIFLCSFLSVYAVSSFVWYGLKGNEATPVEYGLFVLHPFLYLAGVYLLLVTESKYFVVLLCSAVAAFYIYFAEEVKNNLVTHKNQIDFVYVSNLVSLVAVLALVCVATQGFATIVLVGLGTIVYLLLSKKLEITFLTILLLTLFGQTLGSTNTSSGYAFIANERCITYITTAAIFAYVINFSGHRRGLLKTGIRAFATIALAFILFFGATVEILDAKVNSSLFAKGVSEIILGGIYLLIGGYLFYSGNKDRSITIKATAVLFSIYSLYFITTRLLG